MNERRRRRRQRAALRKLSAFCIVGVLAICGISGFRPPAAVEASAESIQPVQTVRQLKTAPAEIIAATSPEPTETPEGIESCWEPSEEDVTFLAKTLYGECRGVASRDEQAAVAWCILNRVDSPRFQGDTVREIVTAPGQFSGYNECFPVTNDLKSLAIDVLKRWHAEYCGLTEDAGRTLPSDYFFFHGDGERNYFRKEFNSKKYWDWSLDSPYEGGAA